MVKELRSPCNFPQAKIRSGAVVENGPTCFFLSRTSSQQRGKKSVKFVDVCLCMYVAIPGPLASTNRTAIGGASIPRPVTTPGSVVDDKRGCFWA